MMIERSYIVGTRANSEDTYIKDRFFDANGRSQFSKLRPILIDGSYMESYKLMVAILACNNADKKIDIDEEIRNIGLKNKSEFVELNERQKNIVCVVRSHSLSA